MPGKIQGDSVAPVIKIVQCLLHIPRTIPIPLIQIQLCLPSACSYSLPTALLILTFGVATWSYFVYSSFALAPTICLCSYYFP